jgi:two-component system phosphate regulon sensor histidine kinase PhoR
VGNKIVTRIKRRGRSLSLTRIIVAMLVGVFLPVLLSTTIGIISLAMGDRSNRILVGVLVLSFAAAAIGGAVVVTVLLGRRARLARLQSDLVTNITHELRTPLAAIRMYAQTLQMGIADLNPAEVEQSLATIVRETEWLEAMIDRILTWRASARDRDVPQMRSGPVREAVEEAVGRFRRMTAPGSVELRVEWGRERLVLHDKNGISAVVLNLLINAYKYTNEDKKISVAVGDCDGRVEISVADNGIGIARRELDLIFDPFYRVDSQLRSKSSGAGLGLALVRHVVSAHAGEIQVESEPGRGSRFAVLLPAVPAAGEQA